jgi:hypothetical protein
LRAAQSAYAVRLRHAVEPAPSARPADPALQAHAFNKLLRAAMHMPAVEALFAAPWTAAARRVLPSPSPQLTATEMWGPVLAWCVLQWLAESVDVGKNGVAQPERTALDLFDRLRLREPFGHAFTALGFHGEEAWRVAARIKVLLLTDASESQEVADVAEVESAAAPGLAPDTAEAKTASASAPGLNAEAGEGKTASPAPQPEEDQVALAHALWLDPDVRWLCGVHESEGHFYLIREQYEELLWWLLMPALLRLAGEAAPSRAAVEELSKTVANALHSAEAAEYRINTLLGPLAAAEVDEAEESAESPAPDAVLKRPEERASIR